MLRAYWPIIPKDCRNTSDCSARCSCGHCAQLCPDQWDTALMLKKHKKQRSTMIANNNEKTTTTNFNVFSRRCLLQWSQRCVRKPIRMMTKVQRQPQWGNYGRSTEFHRPHNEVFVEAAAFTLNELEEFTHSWVYLYLWCGKDNSFSKQWIRIEPLIACCSYIYSDCGSRNRSQQRWKSKTFLNIRLDILEFKTILSNILCHYSTQRDSSVDSAIQWIHIVHCRIFVLIEIIRWMNKTNAVLLDVTLQEIFFESIRH